MAGTLRNAPAPEYRLRRVAVQVSVALFTLLVLAATSAVLMAQREAQREAGRTPLIASEASPTDLTLSVSDDVWRGEQFPVVWIEPAGAGGPVLPPGMERLPEPGQVAVSPALDRIASHEPSLAARYPNRLVLDPKGVLSGSELFAYVRMPKGRGLAGDLAGDLSAETRAARVGAFGPPSGADFPYPLRPEPPPLTAPLVLRGVAAFLVVPGLLVLAVGLAAAGRLRSRRLEVLRRSGAPARRLVALAALQTIILALPGLVAVALLWALVVPRLQRVPLVNHRFVRGDLGLPWWLLAAELGACLAVISFSAVLVAAVRHWRVTHRPRPQEPGPATLSTLRAAPLGVALTVLAVSGIVGGYLGFMMQLAGIAGAVAGVSLILPGAVREVGAALGSLQSVPALVVGWGLARDPVQAARPFVAVAALLIVAFAASGYLALSSHVAASPPPVEGTQTVFVRWLDPRPDDPTRLANALGKGLLVVPFDEGSTAHEDALVIGANCPQLATHFPGTACRTDTPYELPAGMARRLEEIMIPFADGPGAEVRLVPDADVANSGNVLVLGGTPLEELDERVRTAAMRVLPEPYVHSLLFSVKRAGPLAPWVRSGIVVAVIVLAVGSLLLLVDRFLDTHEHRHLQDLGTFSSRRRVVFGAWRFAAPYGAAVTVGFSGGLMVCLLMVIPDTPFPWRGVGITLGAVAVIGLIGTAISAWLQKVSARNPDEGDDSLF